MSTILYPHINKGKTAIGEIIRQLVNKNYYSAKAFYKYDLNRQNKKYNGTPIIIYQMGKVGSTSIHKSLEALELDMPIYHVHSLSSRLITERENKYKKYFRTDAAKYLVIPASWRYQYIRKRMMVDFKKGIRWKIITLVRDPIARNIADFFQHITKAELNASADSYKIKSYKYGLDMVVKVEDIVKVLAELYFEITDHDEPLKYFDVEFKDVLGIDIYEHDFPIEKGYNIYNEKNFDLLLIRLESLNNSASDAFKDFMNIAEFNLIRANVGSNKEYSQLYRSFKDSIVFSDMYVDKMYKSQYMQQFYSRQEIEKLKEHWSSSSKS